MSTAFEAGIINRVLKDPQDSLSYQIDKYSHKET